MQTYEKHIYEVDVIKTYYDVEFSFKRAGKEKNPHVRQYLEQLKNNINILLDERGLDYELVWSHKLPIVILPSIDVELYTNWLGLFLYGVKANKVHLILEYHLQYWNLKESFLNRVEFFCLERLNENQILIDNTNGNIISMWLLRKREIYGYDGVTPEKPSKAKSKARQRSSKEPKYIDTTRSALIKRIVFSPSRINEIYEVLKNCLLEETDENFLLLETLVNGGQIKEPLKIKIPTYVFADIFKRLKSKEVIYNRYNTEVARWIRQNFLFLDKRTKSYKKSTEKTILKVFNGERFPNNDDQVDLSSIIKD
ncbi:MAG: hypothetical protein DCO96_15805 [Fluviicola sp. XM-24bin1]|nr:MAG: hypothetical protein DCO96_15805 [Fluviicola sp. XM-24bin1]